MSLFTISLDEEREDLQRRVLELELWENFGRVVWSSLTATDGQKATPEGMLDEVRKLNERAVEAECALIQAELLLREAAENLRCPLHQMHWQDCESCKTMRAIERFAPTPEAPRPPKEPPGAEG